MKILRRMLCAAGAALLAALLCCTLLPAHIGARADGAYEYTVEKYTVNMTVHEDRSVDVTEEIVASFQGWNSHGIIRDFPLDSGVRYRDISATCDNADFSPYTQKDDSNFLSLYLRGAGTTTGEQRTYTLTYTMLLPAAGEEGYLPLDVVGFGWQAVINDVTVQVTLPAAPERYSVYSGSQYTYGNDCDVADVQAGNVITLYAERLSPLNGITLDLQFAAGVLNSNFDWTWLAVLGIGLVLLAAAVAVKLLVCRQPIMTVTVNLTAPEEMDPLMMGKLIDHKVDSEDMGAMVFYLADKGYLAIDLSEGENDPVLVKGQEPAAEEPDYVHTFYNGLFQSGEYVRLENLQNRFYRTAERVKNMVNSRANGLNRPIGNVMKLVFLALSVLLLGGFCFLLSRILVFSDCNYLMPMVFSVLAFVAGLAAGESAVRLQFRKSRPVRLAILGLGLLIGGAAAAIAAMSPNPAVGAPALALCVAFSAILGEVSALFTCRTKQYSERLGHILGFKQFIEMTENDRIAVMLEEDPQLYYHILPYAQVLGVTDAWTEKFDGLDMQPPLYARYNSGQIVMNYLVWSHIFRTMNAGLAQNMISRPSSSGRGFHSGGFGGGFGGGGFGGGGGRGC